METKHQYLRVAYELISHRDGIAEEIEKATREQPFSFITGLNFTLDTFENNLKDLKKEISALEDRKETLESRIKMAFADAEAITYGGDTLATWKAPKPTAKINTKLLEERYPNIAKEITQSVQGSRRFLLK